ncbi:MAG TPA: DUF3343 domain-containing protein [Candidatus Intestinimonas stercorigallinarum]|nr:DUF3343 domain-containing protein [Candidatus Intestinimonas stercorigallinarum]
MVYYLIVCRSLTYAQRTAAVLERAGITGVILRTPRAIAGEGCGYAVKVSERRLAQALVLLNKAELRPRGVYIAESNGGYRQVGL